MGKAADKMLKDEPKRASERIGGLAGEIPTKDLNLANKAWKDHMIDTGEELPFEEYVRKHYKK